LRDTKLRIAQAVFISISPDFAKSGIWINIRERPDTAPKGFPDTALGDSKRGTHIYNTRQRITYAGGMKYLHPEKGYFVLKNRSIYPQKT